MHMGELEVFYNKIQSEKSIYMRIWRAKTCLCYAGYIFSGVTTILLGQ